MSDEALKLARAALKRIANGESDDPCFYAGESLEAIKQALAAPVQELTNLQRHEQNVRKFLAAQTAPVPHPVIAGVLFDFMGWLTSRKARLTLSSIDDASPAVEAITGFAKMRGLLLDDARVQDWQDGITKGQP